MLSLPISAILPLFVLLLVAHFRQVSAMGNEQPRAKAEKALKLIQVVGKEFKQWLNFYEKPENAVTDDTNEWMMLYAPIKKLDKLFSKFEQQVDEDKLRNLKIKGKTAEECGKWEKLMALFSTFVIGIDRKIVRIMTLFELQDFFTSDMLDPDVKAYVGKDLERRKIDQMGKQQLEEEFKSAVEKLKDNYPMMPLTKLAQFAYEMRALGLTLNRSYAHNTTAEGALDKVEFLLQLAAANMYYRTLYMKFSERDSYNMMVEFLQTENRKRLGLNGHWTFEFRRHYSETEDYKVFKEHKKRIKQWKLFEDILATISAHTGLVVVNEN